MIYLAGSCGKEQRPVMEKIAQFLRDKNVDVYCPFELKIPNAWDYSQEDWARLVYEADVKAINNCDMLLLISAGRMSSAGTNWEQGYAFAKNKKIVVIQYTDQPTSLMTYCGCTKFISSTEATLLEDINKALFEEYTQDKCNTVLT